MAINAKLIISTVITLYVSYILHDTLACSTVIVGKKATEDGSIIIARAEDTTELTAKTFFVYSEKDITQTISSLSNNFKYTLLHPPIKHFAFAEDNLKRGYAAAGINSFGMSVTATETTYNHPKALAVDPYNLESGIPEDVIPRVILASTKSAREGVLLLGKIIETKGAAEGFGVAFADKNEAWYLETASGHRWAAARIPDDSYFVAMNQTRLQKIDLNDSQNYLGSSDLVQFATTHGLYDHSGEFNFRAAFADIVKEDVHYNYYRLWAAQHHFNPKLVNNYKNGNFKVFLQPEHKITLTDVKSMFRIYYKDTQYDPYTSQNVKEPMRPISLFRTADVHIIQMRPWIANPELGNVMYIGMGMPSLTIFVPFYQGITDVHGAYKHGGDVSNDTSAWWAFKKMQTLAMSNFPKYGNFLEDVIAKFEQKQQLKLLSFEQQYNKTPVTKAVEFRTALTNFNKQLVSDVLQKVNYMTNMFITEEAHAINLKYQFINDGRDDYYANIEKIEKKLHDDKIKLDAKNSDKIK